MKSNQEVWSKLHSLECNVSYFLEERHSRPETVNSKHAWDMILMHIKRELSDTKDMLMENIKKEKSGEI